MKSSPALAVHDLTFSVGKRPLFANVSLNLNRAEFVALHGPSGSGKSTLQRAIAGLIKADSGSIRLNNQSPEAIGWPHYRLQVIYVQQVPTLSEGTVRDNLNRPFHFASVQKAYDESKAVELLTQMQLCSDILNQIASSLSGGEQQRICLIRAILLRPAVLLLDEPTSALDQDTADSVIRTLASEKNQHQTSAIIATHQPAQFETLCERSIELSSHGEVNPQ